MRPIHLPSPEKIAAVRRSHALGVSIPLLVKLHKLNRRTVRAILRAPEPKHAEVKPC